ncbi:glycyl-tRNA synthetease [Methanosarcina sp. 2.H.T.1A.6]|uniref:glycine--tRNA ligase n=1 Tax=unclassified Methanosarcina TaxID=2644672 RepID=UPI000621B340|nr:MULTISPECIES: glycine--tRNA ligase [unclassified Methanosarcina]KKG17286.1 glycyl-tRNA synthetease [Methanosarcina sp. 2.H.T.1A.3]KKG20485.1 glycyl-tRNA synthetease [Methanosarcina sp. 2.H.T.1A.6]KKG21336.1 glycyl-tRNA synthetease [Methanosarcina sp. 2.H.T.1A.8]KKG24734.1 glycyl-tRNA synthetease [Methanosarcina sp. 2.H.T.1A.15]
MDKYEKVFELAKRRGFLWNSFELYGGSRGFYDYGPLGSTLKRRIEQIWREFYVIQEGHMEIECPTIGIEDVFVASGHVGGFSDPLCECKKCGEAFRADHLVENVMNAAGTLSAEQLTQVIKEKGITCPECGGEFNDAYEFNLMFKTTIGPGTGRQGYLRPETAQGMFVDFQRLSRFYRDKLPFGAVQIGKSYRNEIAPRQGVIRLREFTQAECEIFVDPRNKKHPNFERFADRELSLYSQEAQQKGEPFRITVREAVEKGIIAHEVLGYNIALTNEFLTKVGIDPARLRFRQHLKDEMAHYAIDCWDAEIETERFGWVEIVGIADRTDYDLKAHAKVSKTELYVYVEYEEPKMVTRFVVKPNMGKLGPLFKGKAKAVADALKQLSEAELSLSKDQIKVTVDGEELTVSSDVVDFAEETVKVSGENVIPHVIEPSYGIDRIFYGVMEHAFDEENVAQKAAESGLKGAGEAEETENEPEAAKGEGEGEEEARLVMHFSSAVAPVQVAVLPLLTRKELADPAKEIIAKLREKSLLVNYDDSGTIGRRYRRNDEIGTPYSVTVDYDTLEDGTVTIRDRDAMRQVRAPIDGIENVLYELIYRGRDFESAGKPFNF